MSSEEFVPRAIARKMLELQAGVPVISLTGQPPLSSSAFPQFGCFYLEDPATRCASADGAKLAFVVLEFLKRRYVAGRDASQLFFYRDSTQREVDLVERREGKFFAYEIKSAPEIRGDFFKNLDYFRKLFGEEVASTQVIFNGMPDVPVAENGSVNFRNL